MCSSTLETDIVINVCNLFVEKYPHRIESASLLY